MPNINYNIEIISLSAYPEYAGQKDVVFQILWSMNGSDGTYSAKHISQTNVEYKHKDPFTEYNLIRPWLVENWIYDTVGAEYIDMTRGYVAKQISDQITPHIEVKNLPWDI